MAFVKYNTIKYSCGSGGLRKNKREGGIVLRTLFCPTPLTFKRLYKERVRERQIEGDIEKRKEGSEEEDGSVQCYLIQKKKK